MELTNDFRVALPVERAWAVLTDLERIAPCMPGAQLQEVEGDIYRGIVKVKVGPITTQYKGQASFLERDDAAHVAVLRAEGRETRGQGNANATITARLTPDGDGTAVSVVTDLMVTGRVAQFGRGVLADVSANLLGQFVESLEQTVLADEPAAGASPAPAPVAEDGAQAAAPAAVGAVAAECATGAAADAVGAVAAEGATGAGGRVEEAAEDVTGAAAGAGTGGATGAGEGVQEAAAEDLTGAAAGEGAGGARGGAAPSGPATDGSAVRRIDSPEPTPVDLVGAAASPLAKRVGPVLALIALAWLLKRLFSRSKP